jgi:NhaP-type Na+/H+ or K+/H+ antiporter
MTPVRSQSQVVVRGAQRCASHAVCVGLAVLAVVGPSLALPVNGHSRSMAAASSRRPPLVLVYTKQNPRWEAPGRGPHKQQLTKPYKPARVPPDSLPPRHAKRHRGSTMVNPFVVLALSGIVIVALAAEWLSASLRLPPAWIPLLVGFVLGPATGLVDPGAFLGDLFLPVIAVGLVPLLLVDLLGTRAVAKSCVTSARAAVARAVTFETVIICAGTALVAGIMGISPAAAALLAALLVIVQGGARGEPSDGTGSVLHLADSYLAIAGIALAVGVCEVAVAGFSHRDSAPAFWDAATAVVGGSLAGVAFGYGLTEALRRGWVAERGRDSLLLAAALTAFALPNLLHDGCGFFAVMALGLYLAHQQRVPLAPPVAGRSMPPAAVAALLIVLAGTVPLDEMTAADAGGLAALVILLPLARLAAWRGRLSWRAQLGPAGGAPATAVVVAIGTLCAARAGEVGVPHMQLVMTFVVAVVFVRLSLAGVAGAFRTRGERARAASPDVRDQAAPAAW